MRVRFFGLRPDRVLHRLALAEQVRHAAEVGRLERARLRLDPEPLHHEVEHVRPAEVQEVEDLGVLEAPELRSGQGAQGANGRPPRPQGAMRSCAHRCALHRLGRLAAQSGRQVAHPPRRARAARQGSGRNAGERRAVRQAGRAPRRRDLFRAARRERGPDRGLSRTPRRLSCRSTPPLRQAPPACPALADHRSAFGPGFRLSPRTTGMGGFYIVTLTRT